jgi:hypothetical protein
MCSKRKPLRSDRRKIGRRLDGRYVRSAQELPDPRDAFVIGGVGVRGARDLICTSLEARGYRLGEDFLLAA